MSRKLKPRPTIIPPDLFWLSPEHVRGFLGYSKYYFHRKLLPIWDLCGLPQPLLMGPNTPEDLRYRADSIYALRPNTDPYHGADWMTRFRARQVREREEYLACRRKAAAA
jgi:hypothetical protein